MADDLSRSTDLIEQLLGDPELRRSFRADPSSVLRDHGLAALAEGLPADERAMMTLELRESRSSLAGVIVAAAAEGVDFTHVAEHAGPRLGRDAGRAISHLVKKLTEHHSKPKPAAPEPSRVPKPQAPQLQQAYVPSMAKPIPQPTEAPVQSEPTEPVASAPSAEPVATDPVVHHAAHHAVEFGLDASSSHDLYLYPGNDATPQQIAAWMGANAQRAGLPPELPVMAALTESGLRNIDYGDRDSVGFFQMRTSIWDEGPYAGYLQNPQKQIEWFIGEALSVRRSDPGLTNSPSSWGEWVADVERPAAEYRYRYQLQLETAQELLRGGGIAGASSTGQTAVAIQHHVDLGLAVSRSAAAHHHGHHDHHGEAAAGGSAVGDASAAGDLSAAGVTLVHDAYAEHGIELPTSALGQFDVGAAVPRTDLAPGDAVFFGSSHDDIEQVGIYLGDGRVAVGAGREVSLGAAGFPYLGARRYSEALLTGHSSYARALPTISRHDHHDRHRGDR